MAKGKSSKAIMEKKLKKFLSNNPETKIKKIKDKWAVLNPWGDDTILFLLDHENKNKVIKALNILRMPPCFTAIYHLDTNEIEFIFTLVDSKSEIVNRSFVFNYKGNNYYCSFDHASKRTLILARYFFPTGPESETLYRNLWNLKRFSDPTLRKKLEEEQRIFSGKKPISFFIKGFKKYDQGLLIELTSNLNFYMQYYDRKSPIIILNDPSCDDKKAIAELQYIENDFPTKISSGKKDPILLELYIAARNAHVRLKYLYYYQILEYAAFYYIDAEINKELKKIIMSPDIQGKPDKYLINIMDIFTRMRQSDEAKLNKVVQEYSSSNIIWREIEKNKKYFSSAHSFEGGFEIPEFISDNTTEESFNCMWIPKTPDALRKIRNALVHGRERRQDKVILPSQGNDILLRPWVVIARRIAEQIIIYS